MVHPFNQVSIIPSILSLGSVPKLQRSKDSSARHLGELLKPTNDGSFGQTEPPPLWKDVLELISNAKGAKVEYESKGEGSKLRRILRNEYIADGLRGLLELIPDGYGLGILRVALSKLFTIQIAPPPSLGSRTQSPKLAA